MNTKRKRTMSAAQKRNTAAWNTARYQYKKMVAEKTDDFFPLVIETSNRLCLLKEELFKRFSAFPEIRAGIYPFKKNQWRYVFRNEKRDRRIVFGCRLSDSYREETEEGIRLIKRFIGELPGNEKNLKLIKSIFILLEKDRNDTLKPFGIASLYKLAEESGNPRFMEGARMIKEAWKNQFSRLYFRAEVKDQNGSWNLVPVNFIEI